MSNEYKDWLADREWEKGSYATAKQIYNYVYHMWYSKAPKDVAFRYHWGAKGVIDNILQWIWAAYIEPEENRDNE